MWIWHWTIDSVNWSGIFMLLSTFSVRRHQWMNESSLRFDSHTSLFMIFYLFWSILVNRLTDKVLEKCLQIFSCTVLRIKYRETKRQSRKTELELEGERISFAHFVEREKKNTNAFVSSNFKIVYIAWEMKRKQNCFVVPKSINCIQYSSRRKCRKKKKKEKHEMTWIETEKTLEKKTVIRTPYTLFHSGNQFKNDNEILNNFSVDFNKFLSFM